MKIELLSQKITARSLAMIAFVCILVYSLILVVQNSYVPFQPVYYIDEAFVIDREPMSVEFRTNVKKVLDYYHVAYVESEQGNILIPRKVWADRDTIWNYTTKANDPEWLDARMILEPE